MTTFNDILSAQRTLAGQVRRTPMINAEDIVPGLWLKAECMQRTGSFKARGALNRVLSLSVEEKARGLVTASAGNHAFALGWAARQAGAACTAVMPATASPKRVQMAEDYGVTVIVRPTLELFSTVQALQAEKGLTLVHPFDDPLVMAGQGTVGLEIVEQAPDVTKVVVGIGGGALIGGISTAVKQLRPGVKVYGVEPEGAAGMFLSWAAGSAQRLDKVETIADGLGAPFVSELTYAVAREHVDDVVLVNDEQIAEAMRSILFKCKLLVEPAGAAATAALMAGKIPVEPDDVIVAVASGGNIDWERLKTLL